MIYKLFLFGQKEIFAYVEIMMDAFLKEGDLFYFKNHQYKILRVLRHYEEVKLDDKGQKINHFNNNSTTKEYLETGLVSELIITEIPKV